MQVLGPHEQLDVFDRAVNVQVAGPPALRRQVREPLQLDGELSGAPGFQGERVGVEFVLRPALDLDGVLPGGKVQPDRSRADEVIVPEREFRGALRLAGGVLQVDAAGNGLPVALSRTVISTRPVSALSCATPLAPGAVAMTAASNPTVIRTGGTRRMGMSPTCERR